MSTVNFSDTTPSAPTGFYNTKWQSDASGNISANIQVSPPVTTMNADYTATPSDQLVAIFGGSNLLLPASPVASEIVQARNFTSGNITVNGNGHNVAGAATALLYPGQFNAYLYNLSTTSWTVLNPTPSSWMSWTPIITANGAMTVSSPTFTVAEWQWSNTSTILYRMNISFTLGGTANTQVYMTAPLLTSVAAQVPNACWVQEPTFAFPNAVNYFHRADSVNGFLLRKFDNSNFVLGVFAFNVQGYYRLS